MCGVMQPNLCRSRLSYFIMDIIFFNSSIEYAGFLLCNIEWQLGHTGIKSVCGSTEYSLPTVEISIL